MAETYCVNFLFQEQFLDCLATRSEFVRLFVENYNPQVSGPSYNPVAEMMISRTLETFSDHFANFVQPVCIDNKLQIPSKRQNMNPIKSRAPIKIRPSIQVCTSNMPSPLTSPAKAPVPTGSFTTFTSDNGSKVHFCDLCPYKSNSKSNMQKHYMLKHSLNCPRYKCSICEVSVKEKNKLKPHYMKAHSLPESVAGSAMRESKCV